MLSENTIKTMEPVSLIDGHIDDSPIAHRLKVAFKKVNYAPVQGAQCKANLYNQFSESALDEIISQLIQLGITIKEGD